MKRLLTFLTIFLLAGCTTVREIPMGNYAVEDAYEVRLGQSWGEMPSNLVQDVTGKILTIDGPRLNRLQLVGNLESDETLVKEQSKEQPVPAFNDQMTPIEISDFIVESLQVEGFQNIKTHSLRPARFGTANGTRFDMTATTKENLRLLGTVLFSKQGKELNIILYLAPEQYYYALRKREVENIMGSVKLL